MFVTQLSNGLMGGEKDKFYEDLEVRTLCVPYGHEVRKRIGSNVFNSCFTCYPAFATGKLCFATTVIRRVSWIETQHVIL